MSSETWIWILVGITWLELSFIVALVLGLTFRINEVLDIWYSERRMRQFHHEDMPRTEGEEEPMKSSDIRKRILEISEELVKLAEETKKRKPIRRAKRSSTPMTPKLKEDIRQFCDAHPDLSYEVIGRHFNVNPGRISNALIGVRE